jgi:hypothetical protein
MRAASIALASSSLSAGLIAAWYWFKSSRVKIKLLEIFNAVLPDTLGEMPTQFSPPSQATLVFLLRLSYAPLIVIDKAFSEVALLNTKAACWTAASVTLGSAGAFVSTLAPN